MDHLFTRVKNVKSSSLGGVLFRGPLCVSAEVVAMFQI